jgi:uncharacterized protein YyaL (SSP411 family)
MSNRLAQENSPYLLQHAENPVDWHPWNEEALTLAQRQDKPIFLSIGYAACHWCHVMAHESFEDPDIAAIMNQHFINIKVDREERPDIDSIYMNAVVSMVGQGGWPLSVFLTPDGRPFFGGTYFPPLRRYNMPSFREVLLSVHHAWTNDRDQIIHSSQQITDHIAKGSISSEATPLLQMETLEKSSFALAQAYDWQHGGWGSAPKFPQPMAIDFLLRRATRGDRFGLEIATHALDAMSRGGMYDVVGGGFARYSTDDKWRVPHFEKMLYDNALLAQVYLHAYLITQEQRYRRICEETLDFIIRELMDPGGGFYSSLDADSEGEEGKYYIWTPADIRDALSDPGDIEFVLAVYDLTDSGNFEGANVLQRVMDDADLAERFGVAVDQVSTRLAQIHAHLLAYRQKRTRPGTDDKVLVSWNALALVAFSEAGRYLRRSDYQYVAIRNGQFLLSNLYSHDRLLRSWRKGSARHNAFLEDYAGLILGLLSLYQTDPDHHWYSAAVDLANEMLARFLDTAGGFFDTRDDQGPLLTRPKDLQDNATPCGNSLAALALLQLAAYTGRDDLRDRAEAMLRPMQGLAARYPTAFSYWLCAVDFALQPTNEVAILGMPSDPSTLALEAVLWEQFRPHLITARSGLPVPPKAPPLLFERSLVQGKSTAYVCRNFVCNLPVTTPADLRTQLEQR